MFWGSQARGKIETIFLHLILRLYIKPLSKVERHTQTQVADSTGPQRTEIHRFSSLLSHISHSGFPDCFKHLSWTYQCGRRAEKVAMSSGKPRLPSQPLWGKAAILSVQGKDMVFPLSLRVSKLHPFKRISISWLRAHSNGIILT